LFSVLLIISSCKTETKQNTLQFNVDKSLLGETFKIDSLQFAFSVPAGWSKISDNIMVQAKNKISIENTGQKLHYDLIAFYLDSLSGSFCSISAVEITQSDSMLKDVYRANLQKKYIKSGIKEGDFVINDVNVKQFLIMTKQKVLFKLLLSLKGGSFLQIDYAIDQKIYPQYINKIESSIGSITSTI
jgi:hypothetical protein